MNNQVVFASNSGIIILGGGLCKHHICNANMMVSSKDELKKKPSIKHGHENFQRQKNLLKSVLNSYKSKQTNASPLFGCLPYGK